MLSINILTVIKKSNSRNRISQFDAYYDIIDRLLNDSYKVFAYKRVLWLYLKDNYRLECAQYSFRRYISSIGKFNQYFKEKKKSVKAPAPSRFETKPGEQAQIDWKENMPFVLKMEKWLLSISLVSSCHT